MFDTKLLSSKFSKLLLNHATPKVSKTDKSDPKRLRKDLPKLVKNIAPEDQMILIGESSFINFHKLGLTSLTIISTLLVNFGLMGGYHKTYFFLSKVQLGKTNGGEIVEASRSDVYTVQKRKIVILGHF